MSDSDCITTIRCLSIDAVQKANSGHPGAPIGMAPVAHVLFGSVMNFEPDWPARDRFVLSNGHACALLYSLLHLYGILPKDELVNFRQLNSQTPGHPERGHTKGVEVTTGPLGQGIANAVGLAIAQAHLNARFPGLFEHKTYCFVGDGCLQEGIGCEATSLAGHLGLNNLIVVYDDNNITIDGPTDLSYSEDVPLKFRALGWNVIEIKHGDTDIAAMKGAFAAAQGETERPTIIVLRTTIGYETLKAGTCNVHGSPLGADGVAAYKKAKGLNPDEHFAVPAAVQDVYTSAAQRGKDHAAAWRVRAEAAAKDDTTGLLRAILEGKTFVPADLKLPVFTEADKLATRQTSAKVITALAEQIPGLIGGSADLTSSVLTLPPSFKDFQKATPAGQYIRFGVREHAMVAVSNGLAAYGGSLLPYYGTFLNFSQYCLPSIRLAAMSELTSIFVATHDSIGLGEDGPTHQPIEAVAQLRALPNCLVIRPADGNETSEAYRAAIAHKGPTVLCLTRQAVATVTTAETAKGVARGAYVIRAAEGSPKVVVMASGSEVGLAIAAAEKVGKHVSVVSAPSVETFAKQGAAYIDEILPPGVPVVSVEAYCAFGWERFAHYHVSIERFGLSAPAPVRSPSFPALSLATTYPSVSPRRTSLLSYSLPPAASACISNSLRRQSLKYPPARPCLYLRPHPHPLPRGVFTLHHKYI